MANPLSSFKSQHQYVAGLVLVAVGVLGVVGSVTGTLAAMTAALFMNSKLQDGTNVNPGLYTTSGVNSTPSNNVSQSNITAGLSPGFKTIVQQQDTGQIAPNLGTITLKTKG